MNAAQNARSASLRDGAWLKRVKSRYEAWAIAFEFGVPPGSEGGNPKVRMARS